jgi:hypothetical protein
MIGEVAKLVNAPGSPDCPEGRSQTGGSSPPLPTTPAWYGRTHRGPAGPVWPSIACLSLRERLEAVWADPRIANPLRTVYWREDMVGYDKFSRYNLFYSLGRMWPMLKSRRHRASPLPRNYAAAWTTYNNIGDDGKCQPSMN